MLTTLVINKAEKKGEALESSEDGSNVWRRKDADKSAQKALKMYQVRWGVLLEKVVISFLSFPKWDSAFTVIREPSDVQVVKTFFNKDTPWSMFIWDPE